MINGVVNALGLHRAWRPPSAGYSAGFVCAGRQPAAVFASDRTFGHIDGFGQGPWP